MLEFHWDQSKQGFVPVNSDFDLPRKYQWPTFLASFLKFRITKQATGQQGQQSNHIISMMLDDSCFCDHIEKRTVLLLEWLPRPPPLGNWQEEPSSWSTGSFLIVKVWRNIFNALSPITKIWRHCFSKNNVSQSYYPYLFLVLVCREYFQEYLLLLDSSDIRVRPGGLTSSLTLLTWHRGFSTASLRHCHRRCRTFVLLACLMTTDWNHYLPKHYFIIINFHSCSPFILNFTCWLSFCYLFIWFMQRNFWNVLIQM